MANGAGWAARGSRGGTARHNHTILQPYTEKRPLDEFRGKQIARPAPKAGAVITSWLSEQENTVRRRRRSLSAAVDILIYSSAGGRDGPRVKHAAGSELGRASQGASWKGWEPWQKAVCRVAMCVREPEPRETLETLFSSA